MALLQFYANFSLTNRSGCDENYSTNATTTKIATRKSLLLYIMVSRTDENRNASQ
jgi:hypothetical protein